jgi:hypothetical protein
VILPNDGDCFQCGKPGHWIQHCPLSERAASDKEHLARIDAIVERWVNGKLLTHQKRHLIEAENELHKPRTGAKAK